MKTQVVGSQGKLVRDFQYLFMGHNRYGLQTYNGPLDGIFGVGTGDASEKMKFLLGYPNESIAPTAGSTLYHYLIPLANGGLPRPLTYVVRGNQRQKQLKGHHSFPSENKGKIIGYPYQGTHGIEFNRSRGTDNWESERALDIAIPVGTKLIACFSGEIGTQFGALSSKDPRLLGLRLHLISSKDEAYYAHMSKFDSKISPGTIVSTGQVLGLSGEANGVAHLHWALKNENPVDFIKGL